MNRTVVYSQEQLRSFDVLWIAKDALEGLAWTTQDLLGATYATVAGLAATQTASPSLTINVAAGRIYEQAAVDTTAYGSLPSDNTVVTQQGLYAGGTVLLTTGALTAGQSQWALIEAQFSQDDIIRANDPTGGLLYYYNSANPSTPFQGPGGLGALQPTERAGLCVVNVLYGTPATTGSEVPPTPSSGFAPLYLIDLTFGQTTITNGDILVSGPSVGGGVPSNYPVAPFLKGLIGASPSASTSHHGGVSGQAPKISLVAEVQGILGLSNLPGSSARANGGIGVLYEYAGNPNGNVAGTAATSTTPPDFCWDITNKILYACTTSGVAAAAVWTAVGNTQASSLAHGEAYGSYVSTSQIALKPTNGCNVLVGGAQQQIAAAGVTAGTTGVYVNGTSGQSLAASTGYYVSLSLVAGVQTLKFWNAATYSHMPDTTAGNIGIEVISLSGTPQTADTLVMFVRMNGSTQFQAQGIGTISWFNAKPIAVGPGTVINASTSSGVPTYVELSSSYRQSFVTWGNRALQIRVISQVENTNAPADGGAVAVGIDGSFQTGQALGAGGPPTNSFPCFTHTGAEYDGLLSEGSHVASPFAATSGAGTATFNPGGMFINTWG